jgi:hypothetical protein
MQCRQYFLAAVRCGPLGGNLFQTSHHLLGRKLTQDTHPLGQWVSVESHDPVLRDQ